MSRISYLLNTYCEGDVEKFINIINRKIKKNQPLTQGAEYAEIERKKKESSELNRIREMLIYPFRIPTIYDVPCKQSAVVIRKKVENRIEKIMSLSFKNVLFQKTKNFPKLIQILKQKGLKYRRFKY